MKRRYLLIAVMIVAIGAIGAIGVSGFAASSQDVHSVWSQKPIYVRDATTGQTYAATSGDAVASWSTEPLATGDTGFYDAIFYANGTRYEVRLTYFSGSTLDQIDGKFAIYKNNVLVATVAGSVVGLSQPLGGIHKFFDVSSAWGLAGAITNRTDF